mmetsp:Transcript_34212/g.106211  ORF Transcript_34212/g.106211 Transcript_34212/m.106211 type:complete len:295 (-) Transcript_34212:487-1371(-)
MGGGHRVGVLFALHLLARGQHLPERVLRLLARARPQHGVRMILPRGHREDVLFPELVLTPGEHAQLELRRRSPLGLADPELGHQLDGLHGARVVGSQLVLAVPEDLPQQEVRPLAHPALQQHAAQPQLGFERDHACAVVRPGGLDAVHQRLHQVRLRALHGPCAALVALYADHGAATGGLPGLVEELPHQVHARCLARRVHLRRDLLADVVGVVLVDEYRDTEIHPGEVDLLHVLLALVPHTVDLAAILEVTGHHAPVVVVQNLVPVAPLVGRKRHRVDTVAPVGVRLLSRGPH